MSPLVRDRLGLQERRQLGLDQIAVGLLIEEDPIGEELVVRLNLRVDAVCDARKSRSVAKMTATKGNSVSCTGNPLRRNASISPL